VSVADMPMTSTAHLFRWLHSLTPSLRMQEHLWSSGYDVSLTR
jgi:hypothetical protein